MRNEPVEALMADDVSGIANSRVGSIENDDAEIIVRGLDSGGLRVRGDGGAP